MSKINKFVKPISVTFAVLLVVCAFFGCSSNSNEGSDTSAGNPASQASGKSQRVTPDSEVFVIMDKLTPETTLEQANEIIGFEGEASTESDYSTLYIWELDDNCSIEGLFFKSGNSRFDANYPHNLVADRADFSNWDSIKSQTGAGTLTYDQLVDLVGGVPGLKDEIRSGSTTYQWYNDDDGYLFAQVDDDGTVSVVSGTF